MPRGYASRLTLVLVLLALAGCSPSDPRSRFEAALDVLKSEAGGAARAKACDEIRRTLDAFPSESAERTALISRAVPLLIRALGDPAAGPRAQDALVAIGLPGYEALFHAAIEAVPAVQDGAVVCLVRMSGTVVPVLLPPLLGDDVAAQERAAAVLVRIGEPISPALRAHHETLVASVTDADDGATLSRRGRSGLLALARVFAAIGDPVSVSALIDGCDRLQRAYPDLGVAYLRLIEGLGPGALERLSADRRLAYERLRLNLGP